MNKVYRLGELFCGPGGLALAAKLASERASKNGLGSTICHEWGVDRDPKAIDTYDKNDLGIGVCVDARDFVAKSKVAGKPHISEFKKINALAFGFPCNDFSSVGKRRGMQGSFGSLYKAGIAAIEYSDPDWFIAENVSGLHSADSGRSYKKILEELEGAGKYGYTISSHLYKFEEYGVPQLRHRYLIVGFKKRLKREFVMPEPRNLNGHYVTCKEALEKVYEKAPKNNELTRQSEIVRRRLLFTPPGKNAWYLDELMKMTNKELLASIRQLPWYSEELSSFSARELRAMIDESRLLCTKARMSHIYRRLDPSRPAYTLTGSGGGGTHVYHWSECRALTNRERARLQGFPDDFEFAGSKEQVRKQIGMAVPPYGAAVIIEQILKCLE